MISIAFSSSEVSSRQRDLDALIAQLRAVEVLSIEGVSNFQRTVESWFVPDAYWTLRKCSRSSARAYLASMGCHIALDGKFYQGLCAQKQKNAEAAYLRIRARSSIKLGQLLQECKRRGVSVIAAEPWNHRGKLRDLTASALLESVAYHTPRAVAIFRQPHFNKRDLRGTLRVAGGRTRVTRGHSSQISGSHGEWTNGDDLSARLRVPIDVFEFMTPASDAFPTLTCSVHDRITLDALLEDNVYTRMSYRQTGGRAILIVGHSEWAEHARWYVRASYLDEDGDYSQFGNYGSNSACSWDLRQIMVDARPSGSTTARLGFEGSDIGSEGEVRTPRDCYDSPHHSTSTSPRSMGSHGEITEGDDMSAQIVSDSDRLANVIFAVINNLGPDARAAFAPGLKPGFTEGDLAAVITPAVRELWIGRLQAYSEAADVSEILGRSLNDVVQTFMQAHDGMKQALQKRNRMRSGASKLRALSENGTVVERATTTSAGPAEEIGFFSPPAIVVPPVPAPVPIPLKKVSLTEGSTALVPDVSDTSLFRPVAYLVNTPMGQIISCRPERPVPNRVWNTVLGDIEEDVLPKGYVSLRNVVHTEHMSRHVLGIEADFSRDLGEDGALIITNGIAPRNPSIWESYVGLDEFTQYSVVGCFFDEEIAAFCTRAYALIAGALGQFRLRCETGLKKYFDNAFTDFSVEVLSLFVEAKEAMVFSFERLQAEWLQASRDAVVSIREPWILRLRDELEDSEASERAEIVKKSPAYHLTADNYYTEDDKAYLVNPAETPLLSAYALRVHAILADRGHGDTAAWPTLYRHAMRVSVWTGGLAGFVLGQVFPSFVEKKVTSVLNSGSQRLFGRKFTGPLYHTQFKLYTPTEDEEVTDDTVDMRPIEFRYKEEYAARCPALYIEHKSSVKDMYVASDHVKFFFDAAALKQAPLVARSPYMPSFLSAVKSQAALVTINPVAGSFLDANRLRVPVTLALDNSSRAAVKHWGNWMASSDRPTCSVPLQASSSPPS